MAAACGSAALYCIRFCSSFSHVFKNKGRPSQRSLRFTKTFVLNLSRALRNNKLSYIIIKC